MQASETQEGDIIRWENLTGTVHTRNPEVYSGECVLVDIHVENGHQYAVLDLDEEVELIKREE